MRAISSTLALLAVLFTGCSSAPKFPVRTYGMGEKVVLGNLIYSAFETQWLTHMGDDLAPRVPQHRFFLVRVSISNSGNTDAIAPTLSVVDDSGKTYEELGNGDGVPQWIGFLRQIHPAESAQGNLVFDCPPRRYRLRVTDESGERAGLIEIPLSFNAESPELIRPPEKNANPGEVFKK